MSEQDAVPAEIQRRLSRLEGEVTLLRLVVARLAATADPRARIAISKMLTLGAGGLSAPDLIGQATEMDAAMKTLTVMISR